MWLATLFLAVFAGSGYSLDLYVGLLDEKLDVVEDQVKQALLLEASQAGDNETTFTVNTALIEPGADMTKDLINEGGQLVFSSNLLGVISAFTTPFTVDASVLMKGASKPQLGYRGAPNMELGEEYLYPWFMSLNPGNFVRALAITQFARAQKWSRVCVFGGTGSKSMVAMIVSASSAAGLSVVKTGMLGVTEDTIEGAYNALANSGCTVFILDIDQTEYFAFNQASKKKEAADTKANQATADRSKLVFLLTSDPGEWDLKKVGKDAISSMQGMFGLRWYVAGGEWKKFTTAMENDKLKETDISVWAGFAADAIRLLVWGAQELIKENDDPVTNPEKLLDKMKTASIQGVTGTIEFRESGRWLPASIVNVQDKLGGVSEIGRWIPPPPDKTPNFTAIDEASGLQCERQNDNVENIGKLELYKKPAPVYSGGSSEKPIGASTFIDLAFLYDYDASKGARYTRLAMGDAIEELNSNTPKVIDSNIRPALFWFNDVGTLLPKAGQAVLEPLVGSVVGPEENQDYIQQTTTLMTSYNMPQLNYGTTSTFVASQSASLQYPYYISLMPNDINAAKIVGEIVEYYGWNSLLLIVEEKYTQRQVLVEKYIAARAAAILTVESKEPTMSTEAYDKRLEDGLAGLKKTGVKLVICWVDEPALFGKIYDLSFDMYLAGGNQTWIAPSIFIAQSLDLRDTGYTNSLLVQMRGLISLYPKFGGVEYSGSEARAKKEEMKAAKKSDIVISTHAEYGGCSIDESIRCTSVSLSDYFGREAVFTAAIAMQRVLDNDEDPLRGPLLREAYINSNFSFYTINDYKPAEGQGDFVSSAVWVEKHEVQINEFGERIMPMEIMNMNQEGVIGSTAMWYPESGLDVSGNLTVFANGNLYPFTNTVCDYGWTYSLGNQGCEKCPEKSYPFDEATHKCGALKPPDNQFVDLRWVIAVWIVGVVLFLVLLSASYWRYNSYVDKKREMNIKNHPDRARQNLLRGWRLDVAITTFVIATEIVDIGLNWVVGFEFIGKGTGAFYLNLTIGYFVCLLLSGILGVAYIVYLSLQLSEVCSVLHKGASRGLTPNQIRNLALLSGKVERRGSITVGDLDPEDARLKNKRLLKTYKISLLLAFWEDAAFIAFDLVFLADHGIEGHSIVVLSLLWSVALFGQKLQSWRDVMFLYERQAQANLNVFEKANTGHSYNPSSGVDQGSPMNQSLLKLNPQFSIGNGSPSQQPSIMHHSQAIPSQNNPLNQFTPSRAGSQAHATPSLRGFSSVPQRVPPPDQLRVPPGSRPGSRQPSQSSTPYGGPQQGPGQGRGQQGGGAPIGGAPPPPSMGPGQRGLNEGLPAVSNPRGGPNFPSEQSRTDTRSEYDRGEEDDEESMSPRGDMSARSREQGGDGYNDYGGNSRQPYQSVSGGNPPGNPTGNPGFPLFH